MGLRLLLPKGEKKPFLRDVASLESFPDLLGDDLADEADQEMDVDRLFAVVSDQLDIRLVLDEVKGLLDFLPQAIFREDTPSFRVGRDEHISLLADMPFCISTFLSNRDQRQ